MGTIQLRGLRLMGTHGVLPEEQQRAQPFEIEIDVEADLSKAGESDALEDTIDYGALSSMIAAGPSGMSSV